MAAAHCEALLVLPHAAQQAGPDGIAESMCKALKTAPAGCCTQTERDGFSFMVRLLELARQQVRGLQVASDRQPARVAQVMLRCL